MRGERVGVEGLGSAARLSADNVRRKRVAKLVANCRVSFIEWAANAAGEALRCHVLCPTGHPSRFCPFPDKNPVALGSMRPARQWGLAATPHHGCDARNTRILDACRVTMLLVVALGLCRERSRNGTQEHLSHSPSVLRLELSYFSKCMCWEKLPTMQSMR